MMTMMTMMTMMIMMIMMTMMTMMIMMTMVSKKDGGPIPDISVAPKWPAALSSNRRRRKRPNLYVPNSFSLQLLLETDKKVRTTSCPLLVACTSCLIGRPPSHLQFHLKATYLGYLSLNGLPVTQSTCYLASSRFPIPKPEQHLICQRCKTNTNDWTQVNAIPSS